MAKRATTRLIVAATLQDKLHVFLFPILPYLNIEPQSTLYTRQMKSAHDLYLTEMIGLFAVSYTHLTLPTKRIV